MGTGGNNVPMVIGSTQKNAGIMEDQSTALTEAMGKGGGQIPMILRERPEYVNGKRKLIRRLTPTECERLQGFPDGWTDCVSDTQRYKTLGNAVTVNTVKAIVDKLLTNLN